MRAIVVVCGYIAAERSLTVIFPGLAPAPIRKLPNHIMRPLLAFWSSKPGSLYLLEPRALALLITSLRGLPFYLSKDLEETSSYRPT